jgi:hypothetical protein
MNLWECDHPGCKSTAVGAGGAIGLRAIGWHFECGSKLLCPEHRPDAMPCLVSKPQPCSSCVAEAEAGRFQRLITADLRHQECHEARLS